MIALLPSAAVGPLTAFVLFTCKVPALIVMPPVNVFKIAPASVPEPPMIVRPVPVPDLVKPAFPPMTEFITKLPVLY